VSDMVSRAVGSASSSVAAVNAVATIAALTVAAARSVTTLRVRVRRKVSWRRYADSLLGAERAPEWSRSHHFLPEGCLLRPIDADARWRHED